MNVDLYSDGLFVVVTISWALVTYYLVQKLPKRKRTHRLILMGAVALAIILLAIVSFKVSFPSDKLPSDLSLMAIPLGISFGLAVNFMYAKKIKLCLISAAGLVGGLLLGALLVNGYYHYYPTLYTALGLQTIKAFEANQNSSITYSAAKKPAANTNTATSIEAQLYEANPSTAGKIIPVTIPGTVSKFAARSGYAYVPAAANGAGKINLPVIVLTAGFPGVPGNWLGGNQMEATMDQFAKLHHGITPYIFMVDNLGSTMNDTECVDSSRGNAETYLTTDVPAYIKSHYEVTTDPSSWALGGLSLGGMCSVMLTLRHPNVYHYFLDFGGETGPEIGSKQKTIAGLFNNSESAWDAHQPLLLLQKKKYPGLGGFLAVGKSDAHSLVAGMGQLYQETQDAQIDSVMQLLGGEHTFTTWQESYKDALPWISNRLGATTCIGACH